MKRSKHSLSHFRNLSCNQGELVPIGIVPVLPGDTFQHSTSLLIRVAPLNTPVMHPVHVRIHKWFVPWRIIWDNFQNFITGGPDGLDATVPPYVTIPGGGFAVGSLADHLGITPSVGAGIQVSALPFRAIASIFNEWYRDQDLVTALALSKADGSDTTTSLVLPTVAWEKDYFTSARPWTQKGAAVTLPLGSSATVKTNATALVTGAQSAMTMTKVDGTLPTANQYLGEGAATAAARAFASGTSATGGGFTPVDNLYPANLFADLSTATAATINDLRRSLALQRYEEARARYGSRYTEYLRYLGVRSSDARLQRPEYLGGGKQTIQFSEVLQTGVTTSGTPGTGVGSMLGHGIGAVRSNRYRRFFEEHGYVVTLLSVLPKTMYVNGLPRMWTFSTKEDIWQKELEHIGQQPILNKEAYLAHSAPVGTFGYQDRYDQYRRMESTVHGTFRTTLNTWHMGRIFGADPALNSTFVTASPTNRIYQDTAGTQLLVMAMHSIQARRLVSKIGTSSIF